MPTAQKTDIVTTERIRRSLAIAARIISVYGDDYLPVFERLELELEAAKNRNRRMEFIRNVANNND